MPNEPDDDFLDHPDSMRAYADDPLTASLRPLFPEGDPSKEAEWKELFDGEGS